MIYRIAKWAETFETADSRRYKSLPWVSLPTDLDSSGYLALCRQFGDDAPTMYGAWCALACVAAKAPERGVLADSKGSPFDSGVLAMKTHFPASAFDKLLAWASSKDVGWLVVAGSNDSRPIVAQPSPSQEPDADQSSPGLRNVTEPNVTEPENATHSCATPPRRTVESAYRFPVKASKGKPARFWILPQDKLHEYESIYRESLSLDIELRKASAWLGAHTGRQKTASGMLKFLTGWLNRAINDRSTSTRGSPALATAGSHVHPQTQRKPHEI